MLLAAGATAAGIYVISIIVNVITSLSLLLLHMYTIPAKEALGEYVNNTYVNNTYVRPGPCIIFIIIYNNVYIIRASYYYHYYI